SRMTSNRRFRDGWPDQSAAANPCGCTRVYHHVNTFRRAIVAVAIATLLSAEAGQVRMSFLNDPASLKETVDFLNHHGCEQQTSRFRSVVESYYAEDFPLDRSKFPKATDWFYTFDTMSNLVHALPYPLSETVQKEVWAALRSDWRRTKLEFPTNCQVVLNHMADVASHMVGTPHAAILFPHDAGYTYLEKAGGPGPFVRLDFKDKSDLNLW